MLLERLQSGVLPSHKGPIVLKIVKSGTTYGEKVTLLKILIRCSGNTSIIGAKAEPNKDSSGV